MTPSKQNRSAKEHDELCEALLFGGVDGAAAIARDMVENGRSQRSLYLDTLCQAARQLGTMWDEDYASFLGVHVGVIRIGKIVRDSAEFFPNRHTKHPRTAIFASLPGDGHTIGSEMAAELFRSKGWEINLATDLTHDELVFRVSYSTIQTLCLSAGSNTSMHKLYKLVPVLRKKRPGLKILVSGSLVSRSMEPIKLLGVDACAATFWQAERALLKMTELSV